MSDDVSMPWPPLVQELLQAVEFTDPGERSAVPAAAFVAFKARARDQYLSDRALCVSLYALWWQLKEKGLTAFAEQCHELALIILNGSAAEEVMAAALERVRPPRESAGGKSGIAPPTAGGVGLRRPR